MDMNLHSLKRKEPDSSLGMMIASSIPTSINVPPLEASYLTRSGHHVSTNKPGKKSNIIVFPLALEVVVKVLNTFEQTAGGVLEFFNLFFQVMIIFCVISVISMEPTILGSISLC